MCEAMNPVLFSSKNEVWATPQDFYDKLNEEFRFTLDPCALPDNAKCDKFYTPTDNGLTKSWGGEIVYCNPPYGKTIYSWVEKCYNEARNATVVALLPARTDTRWFHNFIYGKAREVRFVKGRLKFGGSANSAPFPSMVVVF